jgi:hypothetical protein
MKRYLLFIYAQYYPEGGMKDFFSSYETIELAKQAYELQLLKYYESVKLGYDSKLEYLNYEKEHFLYHIFDTKTMEIVKE